MFPAVLFCIAQACSDDPFPLGNERIAFDYSSGGSVPTTAEVWVDGRYCLAVLYPTSAVDLPPDCRGDAITVRACNAAGCSGFSNPVEVWPWLCIDGNHEVPCYEGAPLRLPTSGR